MKLNPQVELCRGKGGQFTRHLFWGKKCMRENVWENTYIYYLSYTKNRKSPQVICQSAYTCSPAQQSCIRLSSSTFLLIFIHLNVFEHSDLRFSLTLRLAYFPLCLPSASTATPTCTRLRPSNARRMPPARHQSWTKPPFRP